MQVQKYNICWPICINYYFNPFQNHGSNLILTFTLQYFLYIKYNPAHNKKMSCIPVMCAIYNLHLQITFIEIIQQKSYRCYAESKTNTFTNPKEA